LSNLEVLFLVIPSVVMCGITMYFKRVHEGMSDERAVTLGWTYGILAVAFFVFVFFIKFAANWT